MTKSDFEKFLVLHPEFDKDPINENMTTQQNIQNFQESQSSSKGKKKKPDHILIVTKTDERGHMRYAAGYGWKEAGTITSPEEWAKYLSAQRPWTSE